MKHRNAAELEITAVFVLLAACLSGCLPVSDLREIAEIDLRPPVLLELSVPAEREIRLLFDQEIAAEKDCLQLSPGIPIISAHPEESELIIILGRDQQLGTEYYLEGKVTDVRGNSMNFIVPFYGYNPRVPGLILNEFTTQGSANHPDLVEIRTSSAGNLAGITVYEGTKYNYEQRKVLPPLEVDEGTYLLVHFKPEGIPGEIDETELPDTSEGRDVCAAAWDFWVEGGSGLSGNNGVLAVYDSPSGKLIDGVLYSNRTSLSDERYLGFGSQKVLDRARALHEAGGWAIAGTEIAPEDGINPDPSTATRSICRDSRGTDTDTAADWHVVPTGGYTFGGENTDEVYVP